MRFSEVLWEVVGSDGFVDGLMVRSWRSLCWVLAMWFHLSLLSPARFKRSRAGPFEHEQAQPMVKAG
jgi:hypothetical protein